jgi:PilZ domain-containing protein
MLTSPPRGSAPSERRQFGRRSTVWHAWVVTSTKQRYACCIRNVSSGGALLELENTSVVPLRFDLEIDTHELLVLCEVRHRGQHGVGITFIDEAKGRQLADIARDVLPANPSDSAVPSGRTSRQSLLRSELRSKMKAALQKARLRR